LNETLQGQKTVFDLTFGNGNVSKYLLKQNHKVLALNNNKSSFQQIEDLKRENSNFVGLNGKLSDLPLLLVKNNLTKWTESCSVLVVQFGPSPLHLKLGRGLDYSLEEPLDLRMGDEEGHTAANLLEFLGLNELVSILSKYGAVHSAKEIAISIIEQRYLNNNVKTTTELKEIITQSCSNKEFYMTEQGPYLIQSNIDKTFLALRMFVNNELNEMKFVIDFARTILPDQGKFLVSLQTDKEERHFRNLLFAKSDVVDEHVDWKFGNSYDMGDNVIMYEITRCKEDS